MTEAEAAAKGDRFTGETVREAVGKRAFKAACDTYLATIRRAQHLTNVAGMPSERGQFGPQGGLFSEEILLTQNVVQFERDRASRLLKIVGT